MSLVAGSILLFSAYGVSAQPNSSQQVIFSAQNPPSTGLFDLTGDGVTPFGLWIWCEGESGNPYAGICAGSMYFYGLGLVRSVFGFPPDAGLSQLGTDEFQMEVSSQTGDIACTLTNVPPIESGPNNVITVTCTEPAGSGVANNAVVKVTGP